VHGVADGPRASDGRVARFVGGHDLELVRIVPAVPRLQVGHDPHGTAADPDSGRRDSGRDQTDVPDRLAQGVTPFRPLLSATPKGATASCTAIWMYSAVPVGTPEGQVKGSVIAPPALVPRPTVSTKG